MKSITFGQYYPAESIIHRADPRTKVILATIYIVCAFVCKNMLSFSLLILSSVLIIFMGRIPLKTVLKSIKPIIFVMIFMALINIFLTQSGTLLLEVWKIKIYSGGIYAGASAVVRVVTLIVGTGMFLTYTTTPIALTDGIEQLFGFLKKLKVPVHEFAMMMTIALRFIPTLMEETDKIISAQKARGADFSSGGLIKRAKALVPILIPLFISAFRRADELAVAMECRCYRGGEGRTKLHVLKYHQRDFVLLSLLASFLIILLLINIYKIELPFVGADWF